MKNWIILLLTGAILISCAGDASEDEAENGADSDGTEVSVALDEALDGLTMNDGAKWKVDTSTFDGMLEVSSLLGLFDGEDHKQLGKDIKKELKNVINECKMRGVDHDQYHIVLHAMLEEAKELKKGKTESTEKMQGLMDAYDSHFEL